MIVWDGDDPPATVDQQQIYDWKIKYRIRRYEATIDVVDVEIKF